MKKIISCIMNGLFVLIIVGLSGCGGGGGSSLPITDVPTISNLSVSKNNAMLNEGLGSIIVTFTVDFVDTDGDLSYTIINIYGPDTAVLPSSSYSIPITGQSGVTTGQINGAMAVKTTKNGPLDIYISVIDSKNHPSNALHTTFTVI